jgi:copper homeostasis protein
VSVHVLVRPRVGDFVYTDDEFEIMKRDIAVAKELGADGVVIGILTPDGEVDADRLAELHAVAIPLHVGFHRAFDSVSDQDEALELLVSLQFDTILTSGGAPTAAQGAERIKRLVERAGDRIGVIAGGSIDAENVLALVKATGVQMVHGREFSGMGGAVAPSE